MKENKNMKIISLLKWVLLCCSKFLLCIRLLITIQPSLYRILLAAVQYVIANVSCFDYTLGLYKPHKFVSNTLFIVVLCCAVLLKE